MASLLTLKPRSFSQVCKINQLNRNRFIVLCIYELLSRYLEKVYNNSYIKAGVFWYLDP